MKKFSIIISYKEAHPDRRKNLEFVLHYLEQNKEDNFEVIIVEQDIKPKVSSGFYKHMFLYNPGYFNKSWAYNVGAINSRSELLVFYDCDLLIDFNELLEAVSYLEKYEAVSPKRIVYDVAENVTDPFNYKKRTRISSNFAGGILLIRRHNFFEIGGWDEDFEGWGGEDNAMSVKIETLISNKRLNFELFHLFHGDRIETESVFNKDFYIKNLKLFKKIQKLSEQGKEKLLEYYRDKKSIGNINKYEY